MGIEARYRRLPESKLAELERDPQKALSYLILPPGMDMQTLLAMHNDPAAQQRFVTALKSMQADPSWVDLGKDWHVLHFLLTGDASDDPDHRPGQPLHNAVMGGRPTSIEADYGPVRNSFAKISRKLSKHCRKSTPNNCRAVFRRILSTPIKSIQTPDRVVGMNGSFKEP